MDEVVRELIGKVAALESKVDELQRRPAIPRYPTLADAGAAGNKGRIIFVEDTATIMRDTGVTWKASSTA